MRGRSVLEIGVAIAAALSAGVLAVMLASPWLPQAADAPLPPPSASSPAPSPTPAEDQPPIGLYLLRGPFSFGPCLGLELTAESYPVAEAAEGTATVLWWQRGMTGCDARTGEVQQVTASVARDLAEDDGHLIGYAIDFILPLDGDPEGQSVPAQITILAAQSTSDLLQALETSAGSSGFGLVLDRVPAINPVLNPLPSTAPTALEPMGLYLLEGRLQQGPCLVLELGAQSYPNDPNLVKVVTDRLGRALYFSRSPIPFRRDPESIENPAYHLHLGIYAYRWNFLADFTSWPPSSLEKTEKLEQLRALEHGARIHVLRVDRATHGIDTPEQYAAFVKRYKRN